MVGIFGSHPEDRARERELNRHLEQMYPSHWCCEGCGKTYSEDEWSEMKIENTHNWCDECMMQECIECGDEYAPDDVDDTGTCYHCVFIKEEE